MKVQKIFGLFLMAVMVFSLVPMALAQGNQPAILTSQKMDQDKFMDQDRDQIMEQNRTMDNRTNESRRGPLMLDENNSSVHVGLYNALSNVENPTARAALERNMERFLDRYQERFQRMEFEDVTLDEESGDLQMKAKEPVKYFGFIKGKATTRFNLENNGKLIEHAPWYSIFYSENSE